MFFVLVSDPRWNQRSRDIVQVFETFRKLVSSCLRSPPCATKCLLDADLEAHQKILRCALVELEKTAEKTAERKAPPNNTWMNKHMEYADQLGVRWAAPLPPTLGMNDWFLHTDEKGRGCIAIVPNSRANCRVPKLESKCWEGSWQHTAGQRETCCTHHAARTAPLD